MKCNGRMRKTTLFIATSLDGYIADSNKSVGWIAGQNESEDMPDTYSGFIQDIDTVIMGRNTYRQIVTELSPEEWPYANMQTYVMTHQTGYADAPNIQFLNADLCAFIEGLKQKDGKGIWICGGTDIVNQLIKKDLIDVFHITVTPIILGGGTRLFNEPTNPIKLKLVQTQHYNGFVEMIYEHR